MPMLWVAVAASFLVSPFQDPETGEMKWTLQEGDKFEFRWTFAETRHREPGRGEPSDMHDKREVEAELAFKAAGVLSLTLKKVTWSYGSLDYEASLAFAEGKKTNAQSQLKAAPGSPGYKNAQGEIDRILDILKKCVEGEYAVDTAREKGRTMLTWNGIAVQGSQQLGLFDRLFTHPLLGSGPVRVGQTFKDPIDFSTIAQNMVEVNTIVSKCTAVGDKGIICKGTVSAPIGKTFTANGQVQNLSGNLTYNCEWNFSRQEYLQGAKEETTLTKKVDAKGKDAAFYNESFKHNVTQALTIKKKAPKPGDEKK